MSTSFTVSVPQSSSRNGHRGDAVVHISASLCLHVRIPSGGDSPGNCPLESKGEEKPERQLYPWKESNLVGMAALLATELSCYLVTLQRRVEMIK